MDRLAAHQRVVAIAAPLVVIVAIAACGSFGQGATTTLTDGGLSGDGAIVGDGSGGGVVPEGSVEQDGSNGGSGPSATYRKIILADEPVAFWPCDDTTSLIKDATTSHFDGTFSGALPPAFGEGLFGNQSGSLVFDGSVGMLVTAPTTFPYLATSPTGFTLEAWFDPADSSTGNDYHHIFQHAENTSAAYGLYTHKSMLGAEVFSGPSGSPTDNDVSAPLPKTSIWHHIVATGDGTNGQLSVWIDHAPVGAFSSSTNSPDDGPQPFSFGAKGLGAPSINGRLTELAVYSHVLNQDRIDAHYSAGTTK